MNKQRFLTLLEILESQTDEDNGLNILDLQGMVEDNIGKKAGLKGLRADLKTLENSSRFAVGTSQKKKSTEKLYYLKDRSFKVHELRLLIDAMTSARFIPVKETTEIVNKLKLLTSKSNVPRLKNELKISGGKMDSPYVTSTISLLHNSIHNKEVITFQYGRYNMDKEFHLSRDGKVYTALPYGLVWSQDYYYLIAAEGPERKIKHYRVDRMRTVESAGERFVQDHTFNLSKYLGTLFHMYSGENISVEIEFHHHLINVVIDRFGPQANIQKNSENTFILKTNAVFSDGLVRWLLTWGGDAKVLYPEKLITRMREEAKKFYDVYFENS